ncbi:universal stress protein [Arthrobacter castelli]|uniref:universal stress protein n=1 Tax=Arthrobacter castelli TaxID=271431 RepID=UPI00042A7910|nr:universal stress protein [Arthrobacter castelli]
MTVMVAVTDSPEGTNALESAVAEARSLTTDLIAVNLTLGSLDLSGAGDGVNVQVVDRSGREDRDPVDAVLDEIDTHHPDRLVIGLKRRSRVGKALLGSVSQRLLLESPVPVLAVKPEPGN